jgi:hypothetical protein
VSLKRKFPLKVNSSKITEKNYMPPMLSYGKNLAQFVLMFETQSYCETEVRNEGIRQFNRIVTKLEGFVTRIKWLVTRT